MTSQAVAKQRGTTDSGMAMSLRVRVFVNEVPLTEKIVFNLGQIEQKASDIIHEGALEIQSRAKARCPVKTGRLRDSIHVFRQEYDSIVSISAPYGVYVEKGHKTDGTFVPGVFFIRDSVKEVVPEIDARLKLEIGTMLNE